MSIFSATELEPSHHVVYSFQKPKVAVDKETKKGDLEKFLVRFQVSFKNKDLTFSSLERLCQGARKCLCSFGGYRRHS